MSRRSQRGEKGPRGKQEALRDIAAGKLIYHVCGYPAPECERWGELLWERCGAQLSLGGCVVTTDTLGYVESYNAVVKRELETRFGVGILDALWQEATVQFEVELRAWKERTSEE